MLKINTIFLILILQLWIGQSTVIGKMRGMHPNSQIEFVKQKIENRQQPFYDAYLQLLQYADSALLADHHALEDFSVPGYYRDPEGHRTNSRGLQSDAFHAYACALGYRLSGEEKYAQKSLYFLSAWAENNKKYSEADGPLVMAYSGPGLLIAGELMQDYKRWDNNDKEKYKEWVGSIYRQACNEIKNRKNNWADWGRFGSLLSASFLNDKEELAENIRLIKSDLFHKLESDGHMPEEVRREANGIWYTYFSLAPITAACWVVLQSEGTDLFVLEQEGKSLKKSLDYLLYFSQHPDEWEWFEDPRPGSPDSWPGNLMEAMHKIYEEENYSTYVENVRPISNPTHHFAWTFPTLMKPMKSY